MEPSLYVYVNVSFTEEKTYLNFFPVIFRFFECEKNVTSKKDEIYARSILKIHYTKIIVMQEVKKNTH